LGHTILAHLFLAHEFCGWRSLLLNAAAGGFKNSPNYAAGCGVELFLLVIFINSHFTK